MFVFSNEIVRQKIHKTLRKLSLAFHRSFLRLKFLRLKVVHKICEKFEPKWYDTGIHVYTSACRCCLDLFPHMTAAVQTEWNLIGSLSLLDDFGVTILPLQVSLLTYVQCTYSVVLFPIQR